MVIDHKGAARQLVEIMPFLLRKAGMHIRCCGPSMMPVHFRLLVLLSSGSYRLSDLAAHQSVSMATMSKSIQTLVQRGWVGKIRTPDDRRGVLIEITSEGRRVLADTSRQLEEAFAVFLEDLTQSELIRLNGGLQVLQGLIDAGDEPPDFGKC